MTTATPARPKKRSRYSVCAQDTDVVAEYGRVLVQEKRRLGGESRSNSTGLLESESRAAQSIGVVPPSEPGLLAEISKRKLTTENIRLSSFALVVVRETEIFARQGALDSKTSKRDLERLGRLIDDFLMEHRRDIDRDHRLDLWAARLRLVNLLENVLPATANDSPHSDSSGAAAAGRINDELYVRAAQLSNSRLAEWMHTHETCDTTILHYNEATDSHSHSMQTCGVSALWATMRALMDKWCSLPLSEYMIAQLEQMRTRVAFFSCYRERVGQAGDKGESDTRRKKILGLSVDRWRVRDSLPAAAQALENETAAFVNKYAASGKSSEADDGTKLNSVEFTRVIEVGGVRFASINKDFLEETERVISSMLIELRRCAGFDWHADPIATECDCLACEQLADDERTVEAEFAFDDFIANELVGPYRDFSQKEFRALIWDMFEQPGEREVFTTYNPYDRDSAQNFISRNRRSDSKTIVRRFMERDTTIVWAELRKDSQLEPSYALLAAIASNYHVQANCGGSLLRPYQIDCAGCDPWSFSRERFGKRRVPMRDLHTEMVTTGTMRLRRELLPRDGLRCKSRERFYEHPLIVKTIGSFCVLYDGRMHLCPGGFGQAFVVWLSVMCEDREICGEMSSGSSLFTLYKILFASRTEHITKLERRIEAKRRGWDPTTELLPTAGMEFKVTGEDDLTCTQF